MSERVIKGILAKCHFALSRFRSNQIYYVTDAANWSFFWDAYYITEGLKKEFGQRSYMTTDPWGLRNQIIHFGDRYAYLNGPFKDINSTNKVFLTWFHGDLNDLNPEMQRLFPLMKEAAKYVQKIVVTCNISREVLLEIEIPEEKIVVIPLGVDLSIFSPPTEEKRIRIRERLGIPIDAVCIGSFQKDGAGWEDGMEPKLVKGPDIFLEVIAKLSEKYNNLCVLLTGPARGYVKEGLRKIGVPCVHSELDDYHDIVLYYQALDLYIISSRSEGGPKALLESWATGVPVISTKVGMSADLIKHGQNGMMAEVEDASSLTDCAIALIEDVALHNKCSFQALEDAKQYDWSLIAERYYDELYKSFL